jgi:hypothetical protein
VLGVFGCVGNFQMIISSDISIMKMSRLLIIRLLKSFDYAHH